MSLFSVTATTGLFAPAFASASQTPIQTQLLTQIGQAESILSTDPFDTRRFREVVQPLTTVEQLNEIANTAIQSSSRGAIEDALHSMRDIVESTPEIEVPEAFVLPVDGAKLRRITDVGPQVGAGGLFGEPSQVQPARFSVAEARAGESLRVYIGRFIPEIDVESFRGAVGVTPDTVYRWGTKGDTGGKTPREIGNIMALYRYLVDQVLSGGCGRAVELPDPMELLRLAYGELAEPFFNNVADDDPWTIVVQIPEWLSDISYTDMFYANVLEKLWDVYTLQTPVVEEGIREAMEEAKEELEAIVKSTYDRHHHGKVLPHRRFNKTRRCIRLLLGEIGDVFDFFLEAKSIIDQIAQIELPGGAIIDSPEGRVSNWGIRLVPHESDLIDLSGVTPRLDPGVHPFKYLEGKDGRDDFSLLLRELRARFEFMGRVQGISSDTQVNIGMGVSVEFAQLQAALQHLEEEHRKRLKRLQSHYENAEENPLA
ncbi:MAG: hypothetical protein ACYSWP_23120, partial [Planctomycetota bacterium]